MLNWERVLESARKNMYVSFDCPKPTQELKSRSDITVRLNQLHSRFHMSQ